MRVGDGTGRPPPFGANMGLRRQEALAAGGFRADLGWGRELIPGEETELMSRLQVSGGELVYSPDAVVDHHIESSRCTPEYYSRWWEGMGRASVRLEPPASASERVMRSARAAQAFVWWSLRAARGEGSPNYAESLRKSARARGRLRELLPLRPLAKADGE